MTRARWEHAPADATPLKVARLASGLTQESLAEAAGISQSALGEYERGEGEPGIRAALALAFVLGLPAEALWPQK
jgi:transcriptional regulator with XRE-family HTH domain